MKKYKIRAVHSRDLDRFLESLGLLKPLEAGDLKCTFCGCQINRENFQCAFSFKGEIGISCDKPTCYERALIEVRR